jgi:hypothetical protein
MMGWGGCDSEWGRIFLFWQEFTAEIAKNAEIFIFLSAFSVISAVIQKNLPPN